MTEPKADGAEWTLHPTGHGPDDLSIYVEPEWLPPLETNTGDSVDDWWEKVVVVPKSRAESAERERDEAHRKLNELAGDIATLKTKRESAERERDKAISDRDEAREIGEGESRRLNEATVIVGEFKAEVERQKQIITDAERLISSYRRLVESGTTSRVKGDVERELARRLKR